MVLDKVTMAAINLHAILRNMEDLCAIDPESKAIIQGEEVALHFNVPEIDSLDLVFSGGSCKAVQNSNFKPRMNLKFTSPEHFNKMIDGKANPIPLSGFGKIGFLKDKFTKLADRLTYYLRPDPKLLENDQKFSIDSTVLTAYTAFFALSQIANYDHLGKVNAARVPNGTVLVEVENGPSITMTINNGKFSTSKGKPDKCNAKIYFDSVTTAQGILSGTLDTYAAMGSGMMSISGKIPMIDNINKVLELVPIYLK